MVELERHLIVGSGFGPWLFVLVLRSCNKLGVVARDHTPPLPWLSNDDEGGDPQAVPVGVAVIHT